MMRLVICLLLTGCTYAFSPPLVSAAAFSSSTSLPPIDNILATSSNLLLSSEVEVAELPSPYVPVLFGLGLLAGVGLLTGSLGDVLDEEASLGLQSGARARKEIQRSRSSYFKNKN